MAEDILYNTDEVQHRTIILLASLQGEGGFSNSEISMGAFIALTNWISELSDVDRNININQMIEMLEQIRSGEYPKLQLSDSIDHAIRQEGYRNQEREELRRRSP